MLFWPIPWKYALPSLLESLQIRNNPTIVHDRYYVQENYRILRHLPLFRLRDTPLRSLYRLHDAVCAASENYTMLEGEYFWKQKDWRVEEIPDPKDPDPVRYAVLASIVEDMVYSFNRKIELGLRRGLARLKTAQLLENQRNPNKPLEAAPAWVSQVPAVEEWISFYDDRRMPENWVESPFSKRRIAADAMQLGNI